MIEENQCLIGYKRTCRNCIHYHEKGWKKNKGMLLGSIVHYLCNQDSSKIECLEVFGRTLCQMYEPNEKAKIINCAIDNLIKALNEYT